MSYIGNQPTTVAFLTDTFSGNGSTVAFTMSVAPATTSSILVAITGVVQDPSTYAVSGTTLTFSAAPPSGTGNVSVRYLGIPASGVATTAYRTVTEFTATAGQTTFSVPSYTVGYINVYRNGVMLGSADYTASTGTTVVLASGATVGDLVTTESFYVSSVLNAIPATAGAVVGTYIADANIGVAKLSATGTPSSTTFLRGDNTWATAGSVSNVQTFDSTGTWTKPTSGQTMARIQVWGGGGGSYRYTSGGGNSNAGSGGGYNEITLPLSNLASSFTATVGSGGAAATTTGPNGGNGGTSSVPIATAINGVTTVSAVGGQGGIYAVGAGAVGYPTTNLCPIDIYTAYGSTISIYNGGAGQINQAQGNPSMWGGGGGSAGPNSALTTPGGYSMYGGAGGTGLQASGGNGVQPGGGGGAAYNANTTGGSGAAGRIIITCW